MPFTPFHFGPSALIGLPLKRWIDIPVFVLANVVIDFEPLAVMVFQPDYPLHGYFHTLLIGGILGLIWGLAAYPLRPVWRFFMGISGGVYEFFRSDENFCLRISRTNNRLPIRYLFQSLPGSIMSRQNHSRPHFCD